ncbi:MAG TPA: threonine--tRNA ligase [Opitutales bacterium]|jgi:threonyl-tRNA synthetase|nr:threonine--tRNA ligase [Opitutales bacterium]
MKKMTPLEELRHSSAHVLGAAVLRLFPQAQLDIGPPTDTGFYYDFDLDHKFTPEDLEKIEKEMRRIAGENQKFERIEVPRDEAVKIIAGTGQTKYKPGRLADIPAGETISFYKNGEFIDLCAGTHVPATSKINAFKLLSIAGAYHRGDEKNAQLQRIYGTAFPNQKELDEWLKMQEEAKKRDHRKIGHEMGLFAMDAEFVGPGLPLWLPKGTAIIEALEELAKETEFRAGYQRVKTPVIAKEIMYKTSGHLPYYAESMFPPMVLLEEKDKVEREKLFVSRIEKTLEMEEADNRGEGSDKLEIDALAHRISTKMMEENLGERYYLKAMNCPHHHRIYATSPRSYRDLPLRLAEYGCCYRYEQSGELMGLMRVRSLNMNDAHIYCTPEQFAAEFNAVNEMYLKYFKIFGIEKYVMRFSTHDPAKLGQKFVNEPALWKQTEDMVREVLKNSGINYVEVANEAAFYGPKIDVQVWSVIGKEFTLATNQVDFAVPAKFGLVYNDKDNTAKTPLCIHRAPLGTHERFIGFLIEHFAGNFPTWLAPEQVRLLPINDELVPFAQDLCAQLRADNVRATVDAHPDKLGAKIRRGEVEKVPHMLVLGAKEKESGQISARSRVNKSMEGTFPFAQWRELLKTEIETRALPVKTAG